jgi:tetratricopeptide (TPR) repeat protein
MSCLDDPTVLRFVTGRLDEVARRRVDEELARCGRCADLVAELLRDRSTASADWGSMDPPPEESAEGDDLGDGGAASRYLVGDVIARGGMGTILAAFDRQLARPVAIKRLDSDRPARAARFAREIRVTASLQHPGIVPIYDSGLLPDGRPFYAMRRVHGASLEHEVARRRTGSERMALLAPVLAATEAVAYAHERGVIHRDLKPPNILVGRFGETVVIDWGLARTDDATTAHSAAAPADHDPIVTLDGDVLGTPRYMSPEQARGEPASLPTDVYALGAILYHALSGSPPVAAEGVSLVLEQVARSEVTPLARVVPGLPGDLVAIVERAMAARPEARYAHAGELAADLRRFQTGQLVAAYTYSRRDLVRRFARRHRAVLALAAAAAVMLAIGGAVSIRRIVGEREHADEQRLVAERERAGAEDLVQFLLHDLSLKLAVFGRLDVLSDVPDRVESYYLTTTAGRTERPETLPERAELHVVRAAVADSMGDGPAVLRHVTQGLAMLDRAPSTPRSEEVRGQLIGFRAMRTARQGDFARARGIYQVGIGVLRRIHTSDRAQRRRIQLELVKQLKERARTAERLGSASDADRDWREAVEILEAYRARDPQDLEAAERLGSVQMAMGQSRLRRGQLDAARPPIELALAAGELVTAREPGNKRFQNLLAMASLSLADIEAAEGRLDQADRLRIRARDLARGMAALEPAGAVWREVLGRAELNLGASAMERSDWAAAAEHLRSARQTHEELVARDPTNIYNRRQTAVSLAELARAENELGHTEQARATWQASLARLVDLAGSNTPKARMEWANGLRLYAAFERKAGRPDAAAEALEQARALVESTPPMVEEAADALYRSELWAEIGRTQAAQRRPREARDAWARAARLLRDLARQVPLEADAAKLLHEVESALAGARTSGKRR